jgi:DNA-binding CsgD family transcriptional regulator
MASYTLQSTFVVLSDWRGRVVWHSKEDAATQIGELAWSHLQTKSQELAKETFAKVASLREPSSVLVVNERGQHLRCWLWPLDNPEIAVCTLGIVVPEGLSKISGRELECLQLLAAGTTVGEISQKLDISVSTVHTHLKNARETLGLENLESLISFSARYCYPPSKPLAI